MSETVVLDFPTLIAVTVMLAALAGIFLISNWIKERDIGALAWWGSAYLIGASAIVLWGQSGHFLTVPPVVAEAVIFVACGMFWNGLRLFYGRAMWPLLSFAGAGLWLVAGFMPAMAEGSPRRMVLGAVIVAAYTFFIAFELARERRRAFYSPTAVVAIPLLHAGIFLLPLALRGFDAFAARWQAVFALETMIYTVGTAFIVLLLVKDRHVHFYRKVATTDHLTGLLNRGAFLDAAEAMRAQQTARGAPVTLLMFDLDRFKSINDRFGHAVGDSALRTFARIVTDSIRATDIVGRLGGEEFAAIVPEAMADAGIVAERLRGNFENAGQEIEGIALGATVSIGLATTYRADATIDSLLLRADGALYAAKNGGRNRHVGAAEEPGSDEARTRWAARRRPETGKRGRFAGRRARNEPDPGSIMVKVH